IVMPQLAGAMSMRWALRYRLRAGECGDLLGMDAIAARREPVIDRQSDQGTSSVELHIWREEGGVWRCDVLTPEGNHTVRLNDQAALSAYIAGHIDMFVEEFELLSRAVGG